MFGTPALVSGFQAGSNGAHGVDGDPGTDGEDGEAGTDEVADQGFRWSIAFGNNGGNGGNGGNGIDGDDEDLSAATIGIQSNECFWGEIRL